MPAYAQMTQMLAKAQQAAPGVSLKHHACLETLPHQRRGMAILSTLPPGMDPRDKPGFQHDTMAGCHLPACSNISNKSQREKQHPEVHSLHKLHSNSPTEHNHLLPWQRSSRSCSAPKDRRDQMSSSDSASPLTCRTLASVTEAGFIPAKRQHGRALAKCSVPHSGPGTAQLLCPVCGPPVGSNRQM